MAYDGLEHGLRPMAWSIAYCPWHSLWPMVCMARGLWHDLHDLAPMEKLIIYGMACGLWPVAYGLWHVANGLWPVAWA